MTEYSEKTERYTKELEENLKARTEELAQLKQDYATFDTRYSAKKKEADGLMKNVKDLAKELEEVKETSRKQ